MGRVSKFKAKQQAGFAVARSKATRNTTYGNGGSGKKTYIETLRKEQEERRKYELKMMEERNNGC